MLNLHPESEGVQSGPASWPEWTDLDRWEPNSEDTPAPYSAEDEAWWAEQDRDFDEPGDTDWEDLYERSRETGYPDDLDIHSQLRS